MTARRALLAVAAAVAVAAGPSLAPAPASAGTILHTCGAGGRTDVCAVADTGRGPVARLTRDGRSHSPTVSRAGTRIAFQRGPAVVTATRAGRVLRTIAQQASPSAIRPVIAPNGRAVAWSEVVVSHAPFTERITYACAAPAAGGGDPRCDTVHGPHLAFTPRGRLYGAVRPAGRVMCPLGRRAGDRQGSLLAGCAGPRAALAPAPAALGARPVIARDGRRLLVEVSGAGRRRIALHRTRGGARLRVIAAATGGTAPVLSPEGRRIAFARGGWIWVARIAGGPARRVARGAHPAWARR